MGKKSFVPLKYTILGVMSGTSLDGIDLAAVEFDTHNIKKFKIIAATTIPYSAEWKKKLQNSLHLSAYDFLKLHKEYGSYIGTLINQFLKSTALKIDYIASHGHTIFHEPQHRFNFQLGDGAFIASTTGITTISDFRTLDIALGGQGAPLVPIGDKLLFGEYDYCLNIGGIANISFERDKKRIAYDICPANMVLNHIAQQAGYEYDNKGMLASKGQINIELLRELNQLDYYQQSFPKSLGREWIEQIFFPIIRSYRLSIENLLCTLCEHIAIQIGKNITSSGTLLITGGGAHNDFLISRIKAHTLAKVVIPDATIVNYKEALIFAFLGLLRIKHQPNTLSSVTGAKIDVCSGIVHRI
ncbi:MAG: anhydro-N-acetylmuramic acid kinase [Bacteroidales bacterium]